MTSRTLSTSSTGYMAVALHLVLYSVFAKLSKIDRRIEKAIMEGIDEAAAGAEMLASLGPDKEMRAEGAVLLEIIEHMKKETFQDEEHGESQERASSHPTN